jgi:hypothetical protein
MATATTGSDGGYTITALPSGTYSVEASAPGFLRSTVAVTITSGASKTQNFGLSPLLAQGELRIVLTWGSSPSDLDSHLWLPPERPYHVYYGRRGTQTSCPYANLDLDDTSGFGPETITIKQRFVGGDYVYAVHNYSGSPDLTASAAKVQVFDSRGLLAAFDVPTTGAGRWWNVLKVNGTTGAITEVNQLVGDPSPYSDTTTGCAVP